jgi:hypothetical protein
LPGKQGLRSDEEGRPAPTGQQSSRSRKEEAIGWPQFRPRDLPAQHGYLMAKDDDLQLLELRGAGAQSDQLDQLAQREEEERDQQRRLPGVGDGRRL